MADTTLFDQLKNRLLNNKWVAGAFLCVLIAGGAAKFWKEISSVLPQQWFSQPASSPSVGTRIQVQEQLRPIYFAPGKYELTAVGQEKVQQYAVLLKANKYKGVALRSHTHAVSPIPNFNISQARAIAVRDAFVVAGVQSDSISLAPYGGELAGSAATAEYANRVEIVILWE